MERSEEIRRVIDRWTKAIAEGDAECLERLSEHAGTLIFATGHGRDDRAAELDWDVLARPRQTVVIYMGIATLPTICRQLVANGLDPATPAALVERATLPGERCITGSVAALPSLATLHRVKAPALIVIGSVVSLRQVLVRSAAQSLRAS